MDEKQIDLLRKIGLEFDYLKQLSEEQIIEIEDKVGDYYTFIVQN